MRDGWASWNNDRFFGRRSRLFGDVHRGRQGLFDRKSYGIGWSAVGLKKVLGIKRARTVFQVKFGRNRHGDWRVGRFLS
ncbi:hypothetical protein [Streptomyces sp. NPDC026589]|uniref:hypothetical protein n=1 Tax=Streptomyces sp. NPDC026589 TaxID=3155609 RepID=UPI0033F0F9EB